MAPVSILKRKRDLVYLVYFGVHLAVMFGMHRAFSFLELGLGLGGRGEIVMSINLAVENGSLCDVSAFERICKSALSSYDVPFVLRTGLTFHGSMSQSPRCIQHSTDCHQQDSISKPFTQPPSNQPGCLHSKPGTWRPTVTNSSSPHRKSRSCTLLTSLR
jgi:hypothetical protein